MALSFILPLASLVAGIALLVFAGDYLVRGSVAVARHFGVPTLIIGLTIVAFGTSAPELVVGIDAVLSGAPTLALGNVVGSNIANVLLVIGAPAIIAPISCNAPRLGKNLFFMLGISLLLIFFAYSGPITADKGALMVILLVAFLLNSARRDKRPIDKATQDNEAVHTIEDAGAEPDETPPTLPICALYVIGGLIGLVVGADLLVDGAVTIARALEVPEAIIGLTLVAIGTSLPELVTAVAAATKGHSDVAMGNVLGSNIFNILGILGISSLFGDIPVPENFRAFDLWVMLGTSLLILPFFLMRRRVGRVLGFGMVALYCLYLYHLVATGAL